MLRRLRRASAATPPRSPPRNCSSVRPTLRQLLEARWLPREGIPELPVSDYASFCLLEVASSVKLNIIRDLDALAPFGALDGRGRRWRSERRAREKSRRPNPIRRHSPALQTWERRRSPGRAPPRPRKLL